MAHFMSWKMTKQTVVENVEKGAIRKPENIQLICKQKPVCDMFNMRHRGLWNNQSFYTILFLSKDANNVTMINHF